MSRSVKLSVVWKEGQRDILILLKNTPLEWTAYGLAAHVHLPFQHVNFMCTTLCKQKVLKRTVVVDGVSFYKLA
jgi:hypothetical protein